MNGHKPILQRSINKLLLDIVDVPSNSFSSASDCDTRTTCKMFGALSSMQPRQLAAQVLNFALVLSTAFMLWKGLSVITDSSSPIVVVLSGSMEPAFERGDLLFLWNRGMETQVGEVVVYNVRGKDIPIVHRVIRRRADECSLQFRAIASSHQRRQQRRGRHRALRSGPELSRAQQRCRGERRGLRTLCGLRDDSAE
nr:signal peptidase complex catalytic subunit sec11 [Quercus suber]